MKLSEIFNKAANMLENDTGNEFICITIKDMRGPTATQKEVAIAIIEYRLDGCYTYSDWLMREHGIRYVCWGEDGHEEYRNNIRASRVNWCRDMAEEFKGYEREA